MDSFTTNQGKIMPSTTVIVVLIVIIAVLGIGFSGALPF